MDKRQHGYWFGNKWYIDLASALASQNVGGVWTDESVMTARHNFNANAATLNPNGLPIGIYLFRYTVKGIAPCAEDSEDVLITKMIELFTF